MTPKHHFWRDRVTIDLLINISVFIKNGISFYHTSNTIWDSMVLNICFIINLQNQEPFLTSQKILAFCKFCLAKMAYSFCALYCKMNPGAKSMPYTKKIQLSAAPPDLNCSAPHFLHNILFWRSVLVWYGMVRRHIQA